MKTVEATPEDRIKTILEEQHAAPYMAGPWRVVEDYESFHRTISVVYQDDGITITIAKWSVDGMAKHSPAWFMIMAHAQAIASLPSLASLAKSGGDEHCVMVSTDPGPCYGWPVWVKKCGVIKLSKKQFDDLPVYSATLPDSYKRPIAEGGRPWKRDLNFYGLFRNGPKWVYCEYIPDPDPKMLGIKNLRIEIAEEEGIAK